MQCVHICTHMAPIHHRAQEGHEAARIARAQWAAAQRAQQDADVAFMVRLRDWSPSERRAMLGILGDSEDTREDDQSSVDETIENTSTLPDELQTGYAKLAKYVPRPDEDEPIGMMHGVCDDNGEQCAAITLYMPTLIKILAHIRMHHVTTYTFSPVLKPRIGAIARGACKDWSCS